MSDILEVVRIVRPECPGGFCEINKTDLKETDVLFDVEKEEIKRGRPARKG